METLNNLMPVLVIGSLTFFMTLEYWRPYFKHGAGRGRQRARNIVIIAAGVLVSVAVGGAFAIPADWAETNSFGVLNRLFGESVPRILIGILLIDACLYVAHVMMHKVPTLWRFHRMHHADAHLDASSGLRAHPFELAFLGVVLAVALPLLGVPRISNVLYTVFALPWFCLNHSNLKFPAWFERWGSVVMSTPNWHRVHHSSYQPETDSQYGCVFSIWDRLFGTTRKANVEGIRFGLERFREPADQSVGRLLKMPFERL
jgi:sterol desaturase/sphingolipid hydroxylase (fatty acid hydroxylase superfamily)